jgi:hypothetical protein
MKSHIGRDLILKPMQRLGVLAVVLLMCGQALAQETASGAPVKPPDAVKNPWAYNLTVDGYIIPDSQSYVNPVFTADHNWLHLEARYNYENLRTGSLWAGYNFSAGKKLVLDVTPMIGGVFGRTTGIAPGCEASLTYKKVQLSISNEYVFDTTWAWWRSARRLSTPASMCSAASWSASPIRSGNSRRTFLMRALPIRR